MTRPVSLSSLYTAQVFLAETSRLPSASTSTELMWKQSYAWPL